MFKCVLSVDCRVARLEHRLFIEQTKNRRAEKKRRAFKKKSLLILRIFLRSRVFV